MIMKKFLQEFKEFALRGSVVDLAVGMIIGTAFTAVVTALTANFIQPILDFVTRAHPALYTWAEISGYISAFISAIINFIIIAFVLFMILRTINNIDKFNNNLTSKVKKKIKKGKNGEVEEVIEEPAPTTKICPYCLSEIAIGATRCPHCTSVLEENK